MTTSEINVERADRCCGALSAQLRLGQKFVGERRRSQLAELDGDGGSISTDG